MAAKFARNAKPHQRLLDFIRDDLNLTGNKEGCGAGECGTCSVFVDGVLMKSCLLPVAKAQGATIETVEALAKTGELSVLQKAFHKTGASQCGYCIPGMVMAATAALRANPFADREEIKERLGGNICRCTGYQKIFDAVELARDVQNGRLPATALLEDEAEEGDFIGKNVRRIDAPSKVSGRAEICRRHDDARHAARAGAALAARPRAHRVDRHVGRGGDGRASKASSPAPTFRARTASASSSTTSRSWRAARCAMSARRWRRSRRKIRSSPTRALPRSRSSMSALPAVFDPDEAMRPGAPVLHDYAPDNVTKHIPIRVGDVEKGFAESDLVVEETYSTQAIEHAYLEPEAGLAYVDHDGVVTIVSPTRTSPITATCWRGSSPSRSARCASS